MLRLEMLPAERGDCLLLEYGAGAEVEHRVLIDGGHKNAYADVSARLLQVPPDAQGRRRFELLVLTHIDADHIDGVIGLLQDPALNLWFDDVWFNGWSHIEPFTEDADDPVGEIVVLGPKQGEFLGGLLHALGQPWNRHFAGRAIVVPDEGELPVVTLAGGIRLTVLSPTRTTLQKLRDEWIHVMQGADLEPGLGVAALVEFGRLLRGDGLVTLGDEDRRSTLDYSEANGSSIALLAEYGDHRLLLSGDAFADVLRVSLDRWRVLQPDPPQRVELDAFKLSHHGSKKNITPQLMAAIRCREYLVSTNGAGSARHPDVDAIAIVRDHHDRSSSAADPLIRFNYDSPETEIFKDVADLDARYGDDSVVLLE